MNDYKLCILIFTLLIGGCDYCDDRLVVNNEYNYAIAVEYYSDRIPTNSKRI
tara:strand:- start:24235 stop:24390 length:156 start_codon:yes stop_codon:yes gene_type:complete